MSEASAHNEIGALIAKIARQWRRAVDRRLSPFGLSEATWLPLLHLARASSPMRQKDLAASLFLDGSSVVRLLDELQASGLIERQPSEGDRRAKAIFLTALGKQTVLKVERSVREIREEALGPLTSSDLLATHRALKRVAEALNQNSMEAVK